MKNFFTLAVALLGTTLISAQGSHVHQVIFLNEGWFDYFNDTLMVPPSVASYDPATGQYNEFASIPDARFATDVLVDDAIYVAADKWLIKYDKNTLVELDRVLIPGIRKIAVWNNRILATRGEYLQTFDNYVQVFQKSTLTLFNVLDTITGPRYAAEGIAVIDDTAYVAVGNGFDIGNEKAIIGLLDLNSMAYMDEVNMGFDARNPDNMMVGGRYIYTLNNKDYGSSSISRFDPETRTFTVYNNIAANSGCGSSVLANDHIYYMEYAQNELARFSITSLSIVDTLSNTTAYYGLTDDTVNHQLYATVTDYFSSGRAYVLDYAGNIKDSFDVGISAGNMALDVRTSVGIDDLQPVTLTASPNPASDMVTITANTQVSSVQVLNALGESVIRAYPNAASWAMTLEGLPAGFYLLEAVTFSGARFGLKLVKP